MVVLSLSLLIASLGAGSDSTAAASVQPESAQLDEGRLVSQPLVRNRDSLDLPDTISRAMDSTSGKVDPEPQGDNVREYWWMSPDEASDFRKKQTWRLARLRSGSEFDSSSGGADDGVGYSIPKSESEREYWWLSLDREVEIKRKALRKDSIQAAVYGKLRENLHFDLIGLRLSDGWYRIQSGLVVEPGPRKWRLHFGGGVLREVDNSTIDLVRRRELKSGYEIRLWEERIVRGPGPLSFYFGFGPRARMGWLESTVDSSRTEFFAEAHTHWVSSGHVNGVYVAGHYEIDYTPTQTIRRSWSTAVLAGTGIRLHSETGMALVGGMEFGSEWSLAKTSVQSATGAGRETNWAMIEPNWTLGVDWFF